MKKTGCVDGRNRAARHVGGAVGIDDHTCLADECLVGLGQKVLPVQAAEVVAELGDTDIVCHDKDVEGGGERLFRQGAPHPAKRQRRAVAAGRAGRRGAVGFGVAEDRRQRHRRRQSSAPSASS
ncbi:MAG: hypothetical protein WDN06_20410 [Asticcacaulis sp.]